MAFINSSSSSSNTKTISYYSTGIFHQNFSMYLVFFA